MKINKEQYDALVAKLDAIQRHNGAMAPALASAPPAWDRFVSRLQAIEQGQGALLAGVDDAMDGLGKTLDHMSKVLCERLDKAIDMLHVIDAVGDANRIEGKERYEKLLLMAGIQWDSLLKKLDAIQGALLHQQFKAGKPKAKRRRK